MIKVLLSLFLAIAVLCAVCVNSASAQCNVQQSQSVTQSQAAAIQAQALADVTNQLRAQQAALQSGGAFNVSQLRSVPTTSATAVAGGGAPTIGQLQALAANRGQAQAFAAPVVSAPVAFAPVSLPAATATATALPSVDQTVCNGGSCGRRTLLPRRSVSRSVATTVTRG